MAGILYLPRLFVYHSESKHDVQKEIFLVMEKKLYNYIMMPAMISSWIFGVLLIHYIGFSVFLELWMQIKSISILLLTHYHFYLGKNLRLFTEKNNSNSSKFFRIINEIPTLLLIIIVFVVVFKPL
jgi:putative membrane protein